MFKINDLEKNRQIANCQIWTLNANSDKKRSKNEPKECTLLIVECLPAMKVDYDQVAPSTQTPQDTFPLSQPENHSYFFISSPPDQVKN